jgi:hypothetical protein
MRVATGCIPTTAALLAVLATAGCAKEIETQPPPAPGDVVSALFDPSASIVPTPTDLVRDTQTGLLAVPVADETQRPAQAEFDRYLNTLDGYPDTATASACFAGELNKDSIAGAFKVLQLPAKSGEQPTPITDVNAGDPVKSLDCPVLTSTRCDATAGTGCGDEQRCVITGSATAFCADAGWKISFSKASPWTRGASYAFYVTNALKTQAGKPLIRSSSFELAAAPNPLCVYDVTQRKCTFNYSTLIQSQVKASLEAINEAKAAKNDPADPALAPEELEKAIADEVLSSATRFEQLRQAYSQILAAAPAAGVEAKDVVLAWSFSVVSLVEGTFDPTRSLIPGPGNDLIYDATKGKVNIPAGSNETPEDKALREGLNTLDGFSTTGTYFAAFSGKLDASRLQNSGQAVDLIMVNLTDPTATPEVSFGWLDKAGVLTMRPQKPLAEKTQYAVLLRSRPNDKPEDADQAVAAAGGIADDRGRRVVASSAFAIARMKNPLTKDGKSQVSVLTDLAASLLEPLRAQYDKVLTALEQNSAITPPLKREDVALMWTFTTQSITEPLTKLRALPYTALATGDSGTPTFTGGIDPTLAAWPAGVPNTDIGGLGKASFTSFNALDPATGALLADPSAGKAESIPFYITLPKLADCSTATCTDSTATCATLLDTSQTPPVPTTQKVCVPAKLPVVVVQHGLTRQKEDFFAIANTLAKGGFAVVAFDVIYHGERSVCAGDTDCVTSASCSAARRCCDKTTPTDCKATYFADANTDGVPDVSGGPAFTNTQNPFAIRDNLRQHVIDASAFLRAIRLGAASGLQLPLIDEATANAPVSIALDADNVQLVSQSLGSILSTLVLATDSTVKRAVLSVPGAPVVKIFETSPTPSFRKLIDDLLKARGLCEAAATSCPVNESAGALQLFHTLQWIVDAADPANFAKYIKTEQLKDEVASAAAGSDVKVTAKEVIVQLAGKDQVIPVNLGRDLASWIGVDTSDTTYPQAGHGFLFSPTDPNAAHTGAAQAQALTFLLSGSVCKPDTSTGQCN